MIISHMKIVLDGGIKDEEQSNIEFTDDLNAKEYSFEKITEKK